MLLSCIFYIWKIYIDWLTSCQLETEIEDPRWPQLHSPLILKIYLFIVSAADIINMDHEC